ncbi:uncharacterized protein [Pyrus communis]|uniref:uncharacterized protein n=1 Tax=Pyrus communis TaxID=23211 RepID=UPI0035BF8E72
MKEDLLIQYFYEGLLPMERQMLDASAGGALVDKNLMDAKALIANRAHNAQQYEGVGQREGPRQQSVNEEVQTQNKERQIQDKRVDNLEKQMGQIAEFMGQIREQGTLPSSTVMNPKGGFETAKAIMLRSGKQVGTDSNTSKSSQDEEDKLLQEEARGAKPTAKDDQTLPNSSSPPKPFQTTKDFLDCLERDTLETTISQGIGQKSGFAVPRSVEEAEIVAALESLPQHHDASAGGALVDKNLMDAKALIANRAHNAQQYEGVGQREGPRQQSVNEEVQTQNKERQIQDKRVDNLEKQMGQIAEFMGQIREQGTLPSSTVMNPKGGFETAKAIMLRSGKQVGTDSNTSKSSQDEEDKLLQEEARGAKPTAKDDQTLPNSSSPPKPFQTTKDFLDCLERDTLETTISQGIGQKSGFAVPRSVEEAEIVAALESLPQHHGTRT